ncbi:MAG: hypothetical protein ACPGED_04805 [Flavobacteriales bacterium]
MKFDLETLKTTMMVALVLMLIYVLWKRLKAVMGKDALNNSYAKLTNDSFEIQNGILVVDFWLPADCLTKLTINGDQGIEIKEVINEKLNAGNHAYNIEVDQLDDGKKYSITLTTDNQETVRFFSK